MNYVPLAKIMQYGPSLCSVCVCFAFFKYLIILSFLYCCVLIFVIVNLSGIENRQNYPAHGRLLTLYLALFYSCYIEVMVLTY
jgi:hypothetical protein